MPQLLSFYCKEQGQPLLFLVKGHKFRQNHACLHLEVCRTADELAKAHRSLLRICKYVHLELCFLKAQYLPRSKELQLEKNLSVLQCN